MEIHGSLKLIESADNYWVLMFLAVLCYWYAYQLRLLAT